MDGTTTSQQAEEVKTVPAQEAQNEASKEVKTPDIESAVQAAVQAALDAERAAAAKQKELDSMSEEEKEASKRADLDNREKQIVARELKADAIQELAKANLPTELAEALNYDSKDFCDKSLEAVKKAFSVAVEKAVNDRLRSVKLPAAGTAAPETRTTSSAQETINIIKDACKR